MVTVKIHYEINTNLRNQAYVAASMNQISVFLYLAECEEASLCLDQIDRDFIFEM